MNHMANTMSISKHMAQGHENARKNLFFGASQKNFTLFLLCEFKNNVSESKELEQFLWKSGYDRITLMQTVKFSLK